jgi:hypothetical protein
MKKIVLGIVFLNFSIFSQAVEKAKISFLIGKVSVKTNEANSTWRQVKLNDQVAEGDTVMTGNGSLVSISFKGSDFKLQPNTTLVLKSLFSKEKEGNLEVKNGMAWYKLVDLKGQKVNSITPTSTAGVRGTAFATSFDEKTKTAMNCICEGKVEVNSTESGSKPKLVEKGFGGIVKDGSKEVMLSDYKKDIVKATAKPSFEQKVKDNPMLKNCLTCHKPTGWTTEGIISDEKYTK